MIFQTGQWVLWAATEAEAAQSIVPAWMKLLLTAGVFLVPYVLGVLIARGLKLKEYAFKISLVLFTATLGLMPFVYQVILGNLEQSKYEAQVKAYDDWNDNRPITDDHIKEIQKNHPTLQISGAQSDDESPQISAGG